MKLRTEAEEIELLKFLEQKDRERVAPKVEKLREPAPRKALTGGRGAGAKTSGAASLLVQNMEKGLIKKWLCAREIQESLEESSFLAIWEQVEKLQYNGWVPVPSKSKIVNTKTGGYFKFSGLKDIRAVSSKKSLQSYDGCWVEECESIPMDVWDILLPTFRKPGAEIWVTFNRKEEIDPVYEIFFIDPLPGTIAIELEPGKIDNPWFPEILQVQMDHMYKTRPDTAEHVWGGKPLKQGADSVLSRVSIREAMDRNIINPEGAFTVGCDPADMGDDTTQIYKRKGLKIVDHKELIKRDGQAVAIAIGMIINKDPSIPCRIDSTGIGTSTRDFCRDMGLKTIPIHFAQGATDKDKYANYITEAWFKFSEIIDECDIPDDKDLMQELAGRKFTYDKKGRYVLEPKDKFKKRLGRSTDRADALILCYAMGGSIMMSNKDKEAMAMRRRR